MKSILFIVGFFFGTQSALCQNDLTIWQQFVHSLKNDQFNPDQILPYEGMSKQGLFEQLQKLKGYADKASSWQEWPAAPETFVVGDHVHFIIPLGFGSENKTDFCFTFVKKNGRLYYRHLENIFIRLDQTPAPPTSGFPDVPEVMKAGQREETYWSQIVSNAFSSLQGFERTRHYVVMIYFVYCKMPLL